MNSFQVAAKRYWVRALIVVLIALSVWVMVAKTHSGKPRYPFHYGLDIRGGVRAVLQARTGSLPAGVKWDTATAATVQQTLENRINAAGVGEASVQRKGDTQFIIELPDVKDKNAILERLGTTAQMTFYYFQDVKSGKHPNAPVQIFHPRDASGHESTTLTFLDTRTQQTFRDGAQIRAAFTGLLTQGTAPRTGATQAAIPAPLSEFLASNDPIYLTPAQMQTVADLNRELVAWRNFLSHQPIILTGADIKPQSVAHLGGNSGAEPLVTQEFNPSGAEKMGAFTRAHYGENGMGDIMGIVLDDAVLSAPNIEGVISDEGQITGFSTLAEAQNLASLLNAGALPVPMEQVQTESVEASLGAGAVHQSVIAGVIGLALVLIFMLGYYRLPGLVADIALLIYALFTLAIFKAGFPLFNVPPITLTLPGIAGFILSIGMAVDANILIFERLKEELRAGKSLRGAIDAGFKRAFTAIRDSNICTCITCIVLLSLGTASVRGFALTLLIGVIVSLFSAITVTRTLLHLLVNAGIGNNPALFGLNVVGAGLRREGAPVSNAGTTDVMAGTGARLNIIGRRRFFYALSLAIIVPGMIFWALGGLKRSFEFTGGTQMEVRYPQVVTQQQIKTALTQNGYKDALVQMAEAGTVAIVSTKQYSAIGNPTLNPVHQGLARALAIVGPSTEQSFGNVGGAISKELTSRAFQAVIIASILIVLYLATVFAIGGFVAGLRLGMSAIVALLHDALVLIGVFAILGYFLNWEIGSLFVTALLTVIGFSVHDTVVIFDRVRENLHRKARGEPFEALVNRSIGQTLARSINTSLTVIMTLLALAIFGGQTTRLLNVALLIGIISGTYSSIFNAASILVDWENWLARRGAGAPWPAAVAAATGGSGATVTPNGGSPRPLPSRPPASPLAAEPTGAKVYDSSANGGSDGAASPRVRPKKKGPARRF